MFNEKQTESSVSLSLTVNNIDAGSYIARVPQSKVDLVNIVSDIKAKYPGLSPFEIIHAAELIKAQVLEYIKEGKAIDILELGTLYPAPKGTVPRANPQADALPELTLRFRPSKQALAALAAVSAESYMVKNPAPSIARVASLKEGASEGELWRTYPARITGQNLKVAGDEGGVFLVPEDKEGNPSDDESAWIAADPLALSRNEPKTLEFFVPEEAEEGKAYFIAVKTWYCRSGILRKEALKGFSEETARVRV